MYETNQLKDQLTDRATGVASLWSSTISSDDIQKAIAIHDYNHPVVTRLNRIVTMINERNSSYLEGYILEAKENDSNILNIVAASRHYEELGLGSFKTYKAGKMFLHGYETAMQKKEVYSTGPYKDQYGLWITAFSPILNQDGKVVGVLCVDVDASIIESYKRKLAAYLFFAFMIVTIVVYLSLNWGIRKVLAPVNEIIEGINAVSAGNFNVKLQINDHSEMTKLSDRFNLMTSQLSILFEKLSDTYKEFGSLPAKLDKMHRFEEAIGEMEEIIAKSKIQKELQRAKK
ncbi:HAMP domain-containing protein [Neobacillus sp. PS3-34]|uniref:HAMP domain-containing protein n=1 Tax=Neobacillus sp. PS3-34 TaxID=3070678 RepID=UPI0027DEAE3F|nr:HAMP domain-containing protein [Neobacillus sp. PS3-34]WML47831.1 HAMP domain-containing protein [Neobacillus sp. PS3-34]